jgi:hypothetical protein
MPSRFVRRTIRYAMNKSKAIHNGGGTAQRNAIRGGMLIFEILEMEYAPR